MGLFSFLTNNKGGRERGAGDSSYNSEHPLLGLNENLTYTECRDIFLYWALGKRVATALVDFCLSAERVIIFKDLPTDFTDRFKEIEKTFNINELVAQSATYTRVFGMSGIFISHKDKQCDEKLTYEDYKQDKISFNCVDPLILSGSTIGTDPLDFDYQKVKRVMINSKETDLSRCCILFNSVPFYLTYTPSSFNFATTSIYQNMVGLIVSWNRCVVALERAATKAGSIIFKNRNGGALNSIASNAINKTLEAIRALQNDGVVSIEKDAEIELFNLTGISEIDAIISQMNNIITLALADTPNQVLLGDKLSNGLSDGGEDMKSILICVDKFRDLILKKIYEFIDKPLLYLSLTDEFLNDMLEKYKSDFKGMTPSDLREKALSAYSYEYGNLYPETEATRIDNIGRQLDNLGKLRDLGANLADIEQILNNNNDLFFTDITLEEQDFMKDEEGDSSLETEPKTIKESAMRQKETNQNEE